MSQNSYPKVDAPFTDDQWKNLFLTLGRGIIDKGGFPYQLTARDSTTNTVTIGVDTRDGRNYAVLDGFLHYMDSPEQVPVPPVTTDTVYEIGLVYDPTQHNSEGGPVTLTAWVAPGDNTGGKSRLVLYRMTRKNNLALGSTPYTAERPRACPVFSVSYESELPKGSLVLVDSIGVIRTTGEMFRANISEAGAITWSAVGGTNGSTSATANTTALRLADGTLRAKTPNGAQFHSDTLVNIGWVNTNIPDADTTAEGNTAIKRHPDGRGGYVQDPQHASDVANKRYVDAKEWYGQRIIKDASSPVPWEVVQGSTSAYTNTNLGSTWATVAVSSGGRFGRYPSALKYKKNVRAWNLSPDTVYGVTPIRYEDKESGDTRVGVAADSYVNTLPELVETNPDTGEVEGWKYMLMCVAQQVAIRDLNDRVKALEAMLTAPDESAGV